MQLAVLGTDPAVFALVAAARSLGHAIVWVGDVRPEETVNVTAWHSGPPNTFADWETLLDQTTADAVIVGRGLATAELRAEQLKRLATDAVPVLVVHPIFDSVLTYYELDMIRRETGGIVQRYNPLTDHPVLVELAGWVRDGHPSIGPIHQISCERQVGDGRRETVLDRLARDMELMAIVAGGIQRVSAVGPRTEDASFASLQVQMTTAGPASLRWSVAPQSNGGDAVDLTFVGQRGLVMLHASDDEAQDNSLTWKLEELHDKQREGRPLLPFNAPVRAIKRLVAAVAETDAQSRRAASSWDKATQAMEVVDAIELSLQKGRTIEVHQQQLTEQLAFRGTMAAFGCGLLLLGFAVLVFATLMGGLETLVDKKLLPGWPILLLALLAVFLLLQTVPLIIPKKNRGRKPEETESSTS